jgi:hypothetical protein
VWHKNALSEDKVDETVDLIYVTTRKASSETEIKKKTGKIEIIGMINNVNEKRKVKTVLKDHERENDEDR